MEPGRAVKVRGPGAALADVAPLVQIVLFLELAGAADPVVAAKAGAAAAVADFVPIKKQIESQSSLPR
jgi:hypothetical protein